MLGIQPALRSKRWCCTNLNSKDWPRKLQFASIGQILLPGRNLFELVWIAGFSCPRFGFLLAQMALLAGGWRANSKDRQGLRWCTRSPGYEELSRLLWSIFTLWLIELHWRWLWRESLVPHSLAEDLAAKGREGGEGQHLFLFFKRGKIKGKKVLSYSFNAVPSRKIRIGGGSRLLQIKGTRSFRVKKGGSLSSIRRAGSLKSTKLSRQDSESENEELQLSHSRDTVTDIGNLDERVEREGTIGRTSNLSMWLQQS